MDTPNTSQNPVEKTDREAVLKEIEEIDIGGTATEKPAEPVRVRVERQPVPERRPLPETLPPVEVEGPRPAPTSAPAPAPVPARPPTPSVSGKPAELVAIESVLSENLGDLYQQLDPATQERFKTKGEETATKIELLFQSAKASAKKVLDLIRSWLSIIPGVNKFFLEQEAKIKTDKVMALKQQIRRP